MVFPPGTFQGQSPLHQSSESTALQCTPPADSINRERRRAVTNLVDSAQDRTARSPVALNSEFLRKLVDRDGPNFINCKRYGRHTMFLRVLAITCFFSAVGASGASQPDFAKEVEPILEQRCIQCHGDKQQLSGLRVDSLNALLQGGAHGPAVLPGDADNSLLYRHVAGAAEPRMPFGSTLNPAEIATLKNWIDAGAPWPKGTDKAAAKPQWWAFQDPVRHDPPALSQHPVDAFVLDRQASKGVAAAPRADPQTLVRRAYLDLVGLLPPPNVVDAFAEDPSKEAFAALVDDLLESPRYGERWGRHWLDAVRYADSSGYEHDYDQPHAWRYRDYVIAAFNEDKPYDRFVHEQLAGDEVENPSFESLVATGMLRVGPRVLFREKDNPQYRYTYLDDMIATTGRVFLGLTVDCARCHDHKFDAISQMDYYRTMAVFFPYIRYDFPLADEETVALHKAATEAVNAQTAPLEDRIREIQEPYKALARKRALEKFPKEIQIAVATPEDQRTPGQKLLAAQVQSTYGSGYLDLISPEDAEKIAGLKTEIAALEENLPEPLPTAMGIRDGDYRFAPNGLGDEVQPGKGDREDFSGIEGTWLPTKSYEPPRAHFLPNADYRTKGDVVQPGYIEALAGGKRFEPRSPDHRISSGRRLALAKWIASPDNPLTARVMINRIWMHHFGEGLVYTASNFGSMGTRPTHPDLLDWLATEFVRQGWSIKAMHRLIMTSDTYQMASSHSDPAAAKADPENNLLWRFPQRRLEGEVIRDIILNAAGNLNFQAGGPGFFPPIPEEVRASFPKGKWEMSEPGPDNWRRSVYAYAKRGLRYPMFEVFDQPNMNVTCERRTTTTVPTQALTLLNNDFALRQARHFAGRVAALAKTERERVRAAYRIALSRAPTRSEMAANLEFLRQQAAYHKGDTLDALTDLCDVILNLNEFLYVS